MVIDLSTLPAREQYKLLSSTIVPRPIALVSSRSVTGIDNAAPFSFFGILGEDPAVLAIGIKNNPDGSPKDTAANIRDTKEFVVNLVDEATAEAMNACSLDCPPEVSEAELAGFTLVPCERIGVPRLAECPISLQCRLIENITAVPDRHIVLGEVVLMHVRDGLVDPLTNYIDTEAYKPIGRLFGPYYIRAGDRFEMDRPTMAKNGIPTRAR
jgi:flavin reductase (DIM6/NTAB) family NADH-FMN oxidoreductase RutF